MDRNKSIVHEYAAAFNRGDLDGVCRCFAPGATVFGVLGWGGLEKARPIWKQLMSSFQINLQIDSLVSEGNLVAARYTERGKFVSEFRGTPPTGKTYEIVAMEWFEFIEAGIIRRWGARDSATMFRQLGISLA